MRHALLHSNDYLRSYIDLPQVDHLPPVTTCHRVSLITGATGFIGGFLLKSLLEHGVFEKHYCIVRDTDLSSARRRLADSLASKGLVEFPDDRIHVVLGDVTQPSLGLEHQVYNQLTEEVDVVFHLAATMNWVSPFNLDTIGNIRALKEVLRLSTLQKTKKVNYASSVGCWSLLGQTPDPLMEDALHERGDDLPGGYCQLKWINEQICRLAIEQGIPVNVFRIGDVKGDSSTGVYDERNFGNILMRYFIERKTLFEASHAFYNYLPVDYLTRAMIRISQRSQQGTYQFSNPESVSMDDIFKASRSMGMEMDFIPMDTWITQLRADPSDAARFLRPVFRPFYPFRDQAPTSFFEVGLNLFRKIHDTRNTNHCLENSGITCPEMNTAGILGVYLNKLQESIAVNAN